LLPVTTLLYFAPVPWDSYEQRPHFVIRYFLSRPQRQVMWMDPYPVRLPALGDVRRLGPHTTIVVPKPRGLTVRAVRSLPIEPLPGGAWANRALFWTRDLGDAMALGGTPGLVVGVGRPSALALWAVKTLAPASSFYDAMDDFPEFYRGLAKQSVTAIERELAHAVTRVFATSTSIAAKFKAMGAPVTTVPNGFDMASLPARAMPLPGRAVLGYVGTLAHWFDWQALTRIAETRPDAEVRVIGPQFGAEPALPANVVRRPACSQSDAVREMATFTAGLIPFKRSALTTGVDPLKYYAYRGLGLPVLSTAFGEMTPRAHEAGTFLFDPASAPDTERAVARAEAYRATDAETAAFRAVHDWPTRFADSRLFSDLPDAAGAASPPPRDARPA
jgi:hypothetical protein